MGFNDEDLRVINELLFAPVSIRSRATALFIRSITKAAPG